jgi:integrase
MPQSVHLALVPPSNEKFTVRMPRRKPNAEYRSREHLTEREVERLIEAVKGNRWGHRDATMVPLAYRHGLRAAELVDLRWEQIDLEHALLHVRRLKNGNPATHPLTGRELRALPTRARIDSAPSRSPKAVDPLMSRNSSTLRSRTGR